MQTALAPSPADTDPAAAAVRHAIALLRVVARATRSVFALGRTAEQRVDAARREGRAPYADTGPIKVGGALNVVRMALLMADALRRRLRTPEVRLAMRPKPRAVPPQDAASQDAALDAEPAPRPRRERAPRRWVGTDMRHPMARLLERRGHPEARQGVSEMIAPMTDAQVLCYIFTYLLTGAGLLDDVNTTQDIELLIAQTMSLFGPEEAEVISPRVRGAVPREERAAEAAVAEGETAAPDAMERGPPLA